MVCIDPVWQQARSVQFSALSASSPTKLHVIIIFFNSVKHILQHFISFSCLQPFTYSVYNRLVAPFPCTNALYCVRCAKRCWRQNRFGQTSSRNSNDCPPPTPQPPPTVTPTSPFNPLLPSLYLNNNYSVSETVVRLAWVLRNELLRIINIRCFEIRYTKKIVRIYNERGIWIQAVENISELWGGFTLSGVTRYCKMPIRHR